MNEKVKEKVIKLRNEGMSYGNISKSLNIPVGTIKSICARSKFKVVDIVTIYCKNCGAAINQHDSGRKRKFCNSGCRMTWWNKNTERVDRKSYYVRICLFCGREFERYGRPKAKYCSHACYIEGRYHGEE